VRWLGGEVTGVTAKLGRVSDLDLDVEDTAEILLQLEGGQVASVHLDMVQRLPIRTCRAVGSEGVLVWDGLTDQARLWTVAQGGWSDLGPTDGACDRNAMYMEELRHFLACVRGESAPAVTGEEGRRVLAIALAAKQSGRESRTIPI
jgi:predicted dehydrogenase